MKAYRKPLAMILCAFALVAVSIFGTMAYLTDTDAVTNTFTVGHVDIKLDEALVDEYGNTVTGEGAKRVDANKYHLVPGHVYDKDPTVTVLKGSEEAYVRMLVTVENLKGLKEAFAGHDEYFAGDVFLLQKLCEGWDPAKWLYEGFDSDTSTYEFRYYEKVGAWKGSTAEEKLEPLFETISLPGELINNAEMDMIKGVEIKVVAHAIQADTFDDDDKAWDAFGNQADALTEYETTAAESETTVEIDAGDSFEG